MLNITATLTNLRTNQTYAVNHIPTELTKLQIKGKFNIKFPFGFNRGISAEKVKFVKVERQLLLADYKYWGASANWELSIFYGNLQPLTVTLDFTDISWDGVSFEIGFKITPLLDRVRNFEKTNEFISFTPQNFTLKTIVPQSFQANFNHNSLDPDAVTIANIKSDGLIDADGLEYNIAIPDKNDAIVVFRITQKTATQAASYFNLNIKFQHLKLRLWLSSSTITLKLRTDYLFYYTDGTHEYRNILQDSFSSAILFTASLNVQNVGTFLRNGDLSTLPSNPAKTLADVFLVTYLEVDAPYVILQNAIRIWCDHIFVSHNYIQIDEIVKGVRMSDYLQKVNNLAGEPIFDTSLLFTLSDIVITSTNFMLNFNQFLKCKLLDILEALSIAAGFIFTEIDGKYFVIVISQTQHFIGTIELTNFSDVNNEPIEQVIDFEIGDDTEVKFQILPRLFEKRKYYTGVDTLATLDTMIIKPKVITSGEVIINKLLDKKYDDDLLFLKIENVNYGSFGQVLNQYFSNQNVINRLALLLNSFFTASVNNIYYRDDQNTVIAHNMQTTNRLFAKYYRNITTPATNSVISALFSTCKVFLIDGTKYLPVEYSLNLEPNTLNIKLLESVG
ncbi:MAG TPA: hypothetical protein PKW37_04995 [Salinivirgaceae bacterium]|nr:hypothetical protein [Salinivirgaceae bacterium]